MRVSDKDATVTQGGGKGAPEVKNWKGSAEAAKWAGEAAQVWMRGGGTSVKDRVHVDGGCIDGGGGRYWCDGGQPEIKGVVFVGGRVRSNACPDLLQVAGDMLTKQGVDVGRVDITVGVR